MKILITGGNSSFAKKLKEIGGDKYITPTRQELDLVDKASILKFYENNKDIDGIIFNARNSGNDLLSTVEQWLDSGNEAMLIDVLKLNYIATGALIHLYKDSLRFVVGLSTGMINHDSKPQCCPSYIFEKEILKNTIERFSYTQRLEGIKMFNINPGPMNTDQEYYNSAIKMDKIVSNLDLVENGSFEWINNTRFDNEN